MITLDRDRECEQGRSDAERGGFVPWTPVAALSLLIIDSRAEELARLRRELTDASVEGVTVLDASDEQAAITAAVGTTIDAILLVIRDGGGAASVAMARLRAVAPEAPVVIATDATGEDRAFRAVQAGAQDYVVIGVDDARVMWRVIRNAVERAALARRREAMLAGEHAARLAAEHAFHAADRAREKAEAVERRASFLSDASAALSATLDPREALRTATRLIVPTLAQGAAAFISTDDGKLEPIASVSDDRLPCAPVLEAVSVLATHEDFAVLLTKARRRGYVVLDSASAGPTRVIDAVDDTHACVLIPLRARDQVLGLLALVVCTLRPHDAAADLALAQVFAARVAAAVDNACLYEESRRATRTRDHVLGIVSHDLRNPLSAIGLCANALSTPTALGTDERTRLVATIRDALTWMQRLLGDLVDVAAIEAGRLSMNARRVDPIVLLGRSLNLFEQSATGVVQLAPEVPEWLPAIVADEERILQVLANLISNARKVTPATGVITLGARAVDGAVRFSVADSGPGIPREHHQRIFDWFWRASHERAERGTGLGLAIAKGIVDAHGGRIEVESTPGHGATFSFTVPTARPTTVTSDPAAAARAWA